MSFAKNSLEPALVLKHEKTIYQSNIVIKLTK